MRTLVLAGRRPDAPGTDPPRFPLDAVADVEARLRHVLDGQDVEALVASGACGVDLIAHTLAGDRGLRRRMILPFGRARFRAESVTDRPHAEGWDWGTCFDQVAEEIAAAGDLVVLSGAVADPFEAVNDHLLDEAMQLAAPDLPLVVVVWGGTSHGDYDYTAEFLRSGLARGLTVHELSSLPDG